MTNRPHCGIGEAAKGRLAAIAVVIVVASCQGPTSLAPRLHTVDVAGTACSGVGLVDATLHGSATDSRVAWIHLQGFGDRQAVFPVGFAARFNPSLEVLNPNGAVVFREGDKIGAACGGGRDGELLIGWP
jgi:hypothetical protein